ncbi:MAG: hypothetical protein GWP91_25455, partial [Rhodobacterales bacterium]|nr:hypothetical protein [Rhodobacterales bacterium]
ELYPRIRGTRPAVPVGPIFDQFQAAYAGAYDGEDARSAVFAPYTYDATWLVLYGHAWSLHNEGAISGTGIARGLRKVSAIGGASLPVRPDTWPTIGDAFAVGEAVNLDGASGALDFNPDTGETTGDVEIWVVSEDFQDFIGVVNCEPNGDCAPI